MYTHTCNKPYLDWMVVKVCYHNFIFVIYGHKVRTWKWQRRQREKERKDESSDALQHTRGSSTLFLDFDKTRHTVVTKRLWVLMWDSTWHTTELMQQYVKKNKDLSHSRGINYLLKTGPDLLSFCSSAMFAPLFSKRKEKWEIKLKERVSFTEILLSVQQMKPYQWGIPVTQTYSNSTTVEWQAKTWR